MTTRKYSSRSQQSTLSAALTSSGTTATVVSGTSLLGGATISAGETFTVVIDPDTALEEIVDVASIEFDHYNEDPDIIKLGVNEDYRDIKYQSKSLRSNCRVTNQPDWGDIFIHIKGDRIPTPESLLQYIVSMRKENHFHEEICECVYKRLHDLCGPEELMVACLYTRRGGIDINPVRASSIQLLTQQPITDAFNMCDKTMRQ